MAETSDDVVQAMKELSAFRECLGRFSRPSACTAASSLSPSN
ncbi:hypothetical protein ACP70R_031594 [Stipagrostis hirtigluma subsp. patula]